MDSCYIHFVISELSRRPVGAGLFLLALTPTANLRFSTRLKNRDLSFRWDINYRAIRIFVSIFHHFYPLPPKVEIVGGELRTDGLNLFGNSLSFDNRRLLVQLRSIQSRLSLGNLNLLLILRHTQVCKPLLM